MSKSFPAKLKIPECSQCKRKSEFYCRMCKQDLCILCKEEHLIDFDMKYHDVVIDRLKYGDFMILETCGRHQNMTCKMWCLPCKLPVCSSCVEHLRHEIQDIKLAYQTNRKQHMERIFHIRSETMLHDRGIQAGINSDFKSCQTVISKLQKNMIVKAGRLKDQICIALEDISELKLYLICKLQQQRRHIGSLEKYEHRSEQSANKVIEFLLFYKKTNVLKIKDTSNMLNVTVHSQIEDVNKDDVIKFLGEIQITEAGKRQVKNEQLLKVMSTPVLQKSFTAKRSWFLDNVSRHISCVTSDLAWVSSWNNLNLTDTTGDILHYLEDKCNNNGVHTVTRQGNLIYIDRDYNINKLSSDNITRSSVIKVTEPWKPYCLYCSPFSGDLLVGMMRQDTYTAKVGRYSNTGQELQHNSSQELYVNPRYITENQNGDVIVSDLINNVFDLGVVVVTDCIGTHRFSYTGSPQGSEFKPHGICTDALSHILVCDSNTRTVQMIDKDGQFLSVLLTEQQRLEYPYSLSYDHRSHLLWVGSLRSNTVCVYRHIKRHEYLTGSQSVSSS